MQLLPYCPYFIIRVPKDQQRERREKIGRIMLPPNFVWMKRNMQCGEVVAIGQDAATSFPEATIGKMLIVHHIAEGQATGSTKNSSEYFIDKDDDNNYYLVTGCEFNGRRNETYAIWDGDKIIPHRDFIFVEIEKEPENDVPMQFNLDCGVTITPNMAFTTTQSGLVIPKTKRMSREKMTEIMQSNKLRIEQLSGNPSRMTREVIEEIQRLEYQSNMISKEINKKRYEPFTVAFCNPEFEANAGDVIYCLNIAAQTKIEFMDKEYIVVNTQYAFKKFWDKLF